MRRTQTEWALIYLVRLSSVCKLVTSLSDVAFFFVLAGTACAVVRFGCCPCLSSAPRGWRLLSSAVMVKRGRRRRMRVEGGGGHLYGMQIHRVTPGEFCLLHFVPWRSLQSPPLLKGSLTARASFVKVHFVITRACAQKNH